MAITFNSYLAMLGDAERHSALTRQCERDFENYLFRLIPELNGSLEDINRIMMYAMDMAVEYENDGFNAAVKMCNDNMFKLHGA